MKPYFETESGQLYHGDCLEIMPFLEPVDLVLTDPPYGIRYYSGRYRYGNPFNKIEGDHRYPSELIPKFKKIARKAVFCFCRWDNLCEVEKPKSFIVWVKNNWTAGDLKNACARMWEGILFYPLEYHEFKKRIPDVVNFKKVPPAKIQHPAQKPISLIAYLLYCTTNKLDIILDPFIGSGTTAIACERLNRRWIGIEIEEKYCEIAAKRIEKERQQLKLF